MKKITSFLEQYYVQQKQHALKEIIIIEKLKLQLKQSKEVLHNLRVYVRNRKFKDNKNAMTLSFVFFYCHTNPDKFF